jgi:hypothetical protein
VAIKLDKYSYQLELYSSGNDWVDTTSTCPCRFQWPRLSRKVHTPYIVKRRLGYNRLENTVCVGTCSSSFRVVHVCWLWPRFEHRGWIEGHPQTCKFIMDLERRLVAEYQRARVWVDISLTTTNFRPIPFWWRIKPIQATQVDRIVGVCCRRCCCCSCRGWREKISCRKPGTSYVGMTCESSQRENVKKRKSTRQNQFPTVAQKRFHTKLWLR